MQDHVIYLFKTFRKAVITLLAQYRPQINPRHWRQFGRFNIPAPPVVRPKICNGRKSTSLVSSPLDLHKWGEIHKHHISNKAVLEPWVSPAFTITYLCNHCNIRFENTSKYVDTLTLFSKNLNQRSLTPRWPLTPCLLRSHVWLYPRIIVSKSHGNTSMYVRVIHEKSDFKCLISSSLILFIIVIKYIMQNFSNFEKKVYRALPAFQILYTQSMGFWRSKCSLPF